MNDSVLSRQGCLRLGLCLVLGVTASLSISGSGIITPGPARVFYGITLPAITFACLALASILTRKGAFIFGLPAVVGGAIGAFAGNVLPYVLIAMDVRMRHGGGANIGLGLLALFSPLLIVLLTPACMGLAVLGAGIVRSRCRHRPGRETRREE